MILFFTFDCHINYIISLIKEFIEYRNWFFLRNHFFFIVVDMDFWAWTIRISPRTLVSNDLLCIILQCIINMPPVYFYSIYLGIIIIFLINQFCINICNEKECIINPNLDSSYVIFIGMAYRYETHLVRHYWLIVIYPINF